MSVVNHLFAVEDDDEFVTPNHSFQMSRANPLLTSTPHGTIEVEEEAFEYEPADITVKNPLFGSGLQLQKVASTFYSA